MYKYKREKYNSWVRRNTSLLSQVLIHMMFRHPTSTGKHIRRNFRLLVFIQTPVTQLQPNIFQTLSWRMVSKIPWLCILYDLALQSCLSHHACDQSLWIRLGLPQRIISCDHDWYVLRVRSWLVHSSCSRVQIAGILENFSLALLVSPSSLSHCPIMPVPTSRASSIIDENDPPSLSGTKRRRSGQNALQLGPRKKA